MHLCQQTACEAWPQSRQWILGSNEIYEYAAYEQVTTDNEEEDLIRR